MRGNGYNPVWVQGLCGWTGAWIINAMWKECRRQMFKKKCPFQVGLFLIRSSRRAEEQISVWRCSYRCVFMGWAKANLSMLSSPWLCCMVRGLTNSPVGLGVALGHMHPWKMASLLENKEKFLVEKHPPFSKWCSPHHKQCGISRMAAQHRAFTKAGQGMGS